jgi:hypothetical protein
LVLSLSTMMISSMPTDSSGNVENRISGV